MYAVNSITLDLEDVKAESKGRFFKFHETTSMYHLYHNMFIPAKYSQVIYNQVLPLYTSQIISCSSFMFSISNFSNDKIVSIHSMGRI